MSELYTSYSADKQESAKPQRGRTGSITWANIVAVLDGSMKWREFEATNTRGIECLVESVVFTHDGGLPNLTGWILILSVPAAVLGLGMTIAWVLGGVRDSNKDTN